MDFEYPLETGGRGDDVNVGFFSHADLVAHAVYVGRFAVRVEGKIVQTSVGKAVSVIYKRISSGSSSVWTSFKSVAHTSHFLL